MEREEDIELRSEEVEEILTRPPRWMIRWGSVVVLLLLLLVLVFSYFIKYPDLVSTQIVITTQTPPEKLIARSSGRIEKIFVQNQEVVEPGTPLAVIANTAAYEDVFQLKRCLDTLDADHLNFPYEQFGILSLGPIQEAYTAFELDYVAYDLNRELNPYSIERSAQNKESSQLQERYDLLLEQFELEQEELKIRKAALARDKALFEKGVISLVTWEGKKLEYLQASKNLKNLQTQLSQTRSSINELNSSSSTSRVNETMDDVNRTRNVFRSLAQLKKTIQDWELNYVISASVAGKVSFMKVWVENQTIASGEQVFTVVPSDGLDYIGKVKASGNKAGKIKVGQKVNVRLVNYPAREFGILVGEVRSISLTPDHEGNILIDVSFPNGIQTSYDEKIEFQQEMTGSADIVTEDLRLIERFFHHFSEMFER
ncbi:MAG: HlyD family efflux transporter periplasmic adaptor subunit [Flavobacteriales bacterium]|nr:HlyD family efflux transporter periplasmic adaptor subunit [Flavobacteriales bacterium]